MSKHYTKFPPDHSTCKEYPWDAAKTLTTYPVAQRFTSYEKVMLDPAEPTYVKIGEEKFMHKKVKELACKLIDAEHALTLAEMQIGDMLDEGPFVPEEFGFEILYKPESITDMPVKVYGSTYDPRYSLHRVVDSQYEWKLMIKRGDTTFDEIDLHLPCHRIAYALFVALDIKVEEEGKLTVALSVPTEILVAPEAEITLDKRIKRTRKALGLNQHSNSDERED